MLLLLDNQLCSRFKRNSSSLKTVRRSIAMYSPYMGLCSRGCAETMLHAYKHNHNKISRLILSRCWCPLPGCWLDCLPIQQHYFCHTHRHSYNFVSTDANLFSQNLIFCMLKKWVLFMFILICQSFSFFFIFSQLSFGQF